MQINRAAWLACMLVAVGNAETFTMPSYENTFDITNLKYIVPPKVLRSTTDQIFNMMQVADLETAKLPMSPVRKLQAENDQSVAPVVSPGLIDDRTNRQDSTSALDTEYGGIKLESWLEFSGGLILGGLLALASSAFSSFFNQCLVQWARVVGASYFFYIYMVIYEEGLFASDEYLSMMLLYFVQFGDSLTLGQCGGKYDNHGFNKQFTSDNWLDYFTIDVERVTTSVKTDPIVNTLEKFFGTFAQTTSDEANAQIIAVFGIVGAQAAYASYQNYLSFQAEWIAESYFFAGAFMGAAIVEAITVLLLVLIAQALTAGGQALALLF